MLRSTLTQTASVYSAAWSPNADFVVHTQGKMLFVKPVSPSGKTEQWKAHDGVVLQVDWNSVNGLIVSGGEDRKYKVWDQLGRILFSSASHDHPITAVKWAPDGTLFAVGSYNTLRLCDQAGWSHALEKPDSGSIFQLAWTDDSTQVAAATGSGRIFFGDVVERKIEWKNFEATLIKSGTVKIFDSLNGATETLEFRDRVVKLSMGYNHLVVATTLQCAVYRCTNWNTPHVFDLKETSGVAILKQSQKFLLIVDSQNGIQVYDYDGRPISAPKIQGMRYDFLNTHTVALSDDTIAVRDQRDEKVIHILDTQTGKPTGSPFAHVVEVAEIALDQAGPLLARHLAVVDKDRNLFLTPARRSGAKFEKLGSLAHSISFHDTTNMLAAIFDGKFVVWYYPSAAYVDKDLLGKTCFQHDAEFVRIHNRTHLTVRREFGKTPKLAAFLDAQCSVRRADGAYLQIGISPFATVLHEHVGARKWEDAVRLCRFVKDKSLWSALAVMAAEARHLVTTEVCYAAIDEVDKVEYLQTIKEIPTSEGRSAALAVFCRQFDEAESLLLQAGLAYRAIELNLKLFRWERALDLAVKHKTFVDLVVGRRQQYLASLDRPELSKKYLQFSEGLTIDWEIIASKIALELQNERSRPGAKPL